ncbi:hypothetical protein H9S92_12090, partial [Lewinella lacunae]
NPLEYGIAGVTVNLYFDADNNPATAPVLIETTTTDADGNYFFGNLAPGNYQVGAIALAGSPVSSTGAAVSTTPNDDTDGNSDGSATTATGQESLSGVVTLVPGTEPQGGDEAGQGGEQDDTAPQTDGNGNMTVDFGFIPTNSVGSTVFYDMNGNGQQDGPNDVAAPGVVVELYVDADGDGTPETLVGSDVTDADGSYFFPNLPNGTYQVVLPNGVEGGMASPTVDPADDNALVQNGTDQPDGSIASAPFVLAIGDDPTELDGTPGDDQDADDPANSIFDANGNMTIDFGVLPNMSIGSTVFYDADNSGDQDLANPLEYGIAGVTVNL